MKSIQKKNLNIKAFTTEKTLKHKGMTDKQIDEIKSSPNRSYKIMMGVCQAHLFQGSIKNEF